MMKDIEIKINRETRMVDLSKSIIGNDGENLQGNLVFSFTDDFVKGQGRLEYVTNREKKYALLLKGEDNYYIPIKSVMTKEGQIDMQLVVTEGTDANEIPIFKSNVFYVTCKSSINAEIEEDEGYYQWIEIANTKLNEVDEAIEELTSQSDYAKEQGDYAKEQGTNAKNIAEETEKKAEEGLFNGKSLEFVWQGTKLGVRLEGQEEYQFVDLQGVQGEIGATGEPFKIKKTYRSVSEMNADFANMQFGDYVMIASSVEVEDNAKLYTRGESAWIFISDFSGAMGIRGETGLTPNIKIGEVKTLEAGSQAKVTRSGSNEEPVFNFEIPKGDKGDDYVLTEEDKVEIGEMVNTEYEKRIEENEKDIVDIESYLDSLTPKAPPVKGELVHITDALGLPTFETKTSGNVKQETTQGYNLIGLPDVEETIINGLTFSIKNGLFKLNGTATTLVPLGNVLFNNLKETNKYRLQIFPQSGTWDNGWIGARGYIDGTQKWYQQIAKTDNTNYVIKTLTAEEFENNNRYDMFVANGSSFNNFSCYVLFKKGEDYAEYELFTNGASPNPEFPQEIEVVESVSIKVDNGADKEQLVPLDLKGNWVGKINDDIKDYLVTDKKKYWLVKNVKKYVFTGNEDWFAIGENGLYRIATSDLKGIKKPNTNMVCSHFICDVSYNRLFDDGIMTNTPSGDISIFDTEMQTVESLKAYLKEEYDKGTPVTAYFLTKETEIIELGELPEPIKTFEGTNNIQVLANLDTEIEVKYALDLKKYYDNKIAELSSQII